MKSKVAIYSLLIGGFALASALYSHIVHGEALSAKGLFAAVLLVPMFGFVIWLRWDWAEPLGRKRRGKRSARKARDRESQNT